MQAALWLRLAGYLTWLVSGIPGLMLIATGRIAGARAAALLVAFGTFGVAFSLCLKPLAVARARAAETALLALQAVSGLVMVWASGDGLPAATLVVAAAQLADVVGTRGMVLWVAAQTAVLGAIFWNEDGPLSAVVVSGAFAGFQLFAIATSWLAHSEGAARLALARTNAELTATRELLAENSRVAERLRIARDLHDTLGHHLTALSIQLDVAWRLSDGAAAAHVREAHAITRLLLGDVRDVVSTQRGSSRIDLAQALRALAATSGTLRIHLEMPDRLDLDDAAQAHALLRCVQEIITNAARHASASNLWIALAQRAEGIDLHARDDGRGAPGLEWGNGLRGMRERFEEYAGRVEFRSAAGQGFEVHGFMPRPEALA